MFDYKAVFDAIEATLYERSSKRETLRTFVERRKHLKGETLSDDEYYRLLVKVVFYAGFRAETVDQKLSVILEHFPDYRSVARYSNRERDLILNDQRMIKHQKKIAACIDNARSIEKIVSEYGSVRPYIDFFGESDEELKRLILDLGKRFSRLPEISALHFLTMVGKPVLKPDIVIKRIFNRLNIVDSDAPNWDYVQQGRKFAAATGHPIGYIDLIFVLYGQVQATDLGLEKGVCLERQPLCKICRVQQYCHYFRRRQAAHA